jgi:hypothetical protein
MKSNIKILLAIVIFVCQFATSTTAQIAINNDNSTADPSAILDVKSTVKGILVPRMTTTQRTNISNAALGLLVFDTDTETFWFNTNTGWLELRNNDQTLSLNSNTLSLSNGGSVSLSGYVNTDNQTLSFSANTLTLTNGGTVNLSGYLDNTDNQILALSSNTLSLSNGGSVNLSSYVNTDNQALSLSNNALTLANGGTVSLSSYLDNTDNQALSLSSNTLSLSNGGSVNLSSYVNTDNQALSLSNNTLSLANGGSVNLSNYVNTDNQALSLSNNTLSLANGGSVNLSNYLDNTDAQTLSFNNNTLTLTNGGSVDLSSLSGGGTSTLIADTDNDTKIQVEESADEDLIRFDMNGTEYFRMQHHQLVVGTSNVAIGSSGTMPFLSSGQDNVAIGFAALSDVTTGIGNVGVGSHAGDFNKGDNNVFLGRNAGFSNINGDKNIFIGYEAGRNESGSNKLYIENSNSTTPLIYGEFDNDYVKINGELEASEITVFGPTELNGQTTINGSLNVNGEAKVNGNNAVVYDRKTIMVSGHINSNGSPKGNVTTSSKMAGASRTGTGKYTVTFVNGTFADEPIVTVTAIDGSSVRNAVITSISTTSFSIRIYNASGSLKDAEFTFIAIGEN